MLYDNLLVWIDDLLLFAKTPEEYLSKLRQFFAVLRARRLKLNAKKCVLFPLVSLPLPPTAAALQQFLCAANWLRDSMIDYARTVHPLQKMLEQVMAQRGRRKSQLAGVDLSWTEEDKVAFRAVVNLLATSNKQHFADKDARVCLLTDASNTGWAIVVSQVRHWEEGKPVAEQAHELLVCRGGQFTGSQLNWSIVEKEAYPVVRACADLAYLLDRENGIYIYCDHANLVYIFAPDKTVKPHLRGKLQRWAMQMVGVRYEIEHITGDDNVWADLVSRWGQPTISPSGTAVAVKRISLLEEDIAEEFDRVDLSATYLQVPEESNPVSEIVSAKRVTTRSAPVVSTLRPLQDDRFVWPSEEAIIEEQCRHQDIAPAAADGRVRIDGKLWVPREACDLLKRILVVAHCGPQGHRGGDVMLKALNERFAVSNSKALVTRFLRDCLLCKHVKGGKLIQRPWGPTTTATRRNECLHMDYLELGESYGTTRYVLVLKDELTHYCELVAADSATSSTAAEAVLDWYKRFGLPEMWESDNGSHFKADLMNQLADKLKVVQKFVPVYTPWINGTVERVNRDILQVLRVMLLELQLDTRNWPYLLPVIQANLNHAAVASLGGHAPVELFTGLPAPSMLDTVVVPVAGASRPLSIDMATATIHLDNLRQHLASMHKEVADRKEKRRAYELAKGKGQTCNFEVGDFVLWSRVDKRMRGGKLLVRWVGPFKITQALSHSFIVAHLLTSEEFEVHGSRLKRYCDSDLGVSAEIREHVASQGIVLGIRAIVDYRFEPSANEWQLLVAVLGIRAIVDYRFEPSANEWQLLVAWRGLEDTENSWEPFSSIYADVPTLVTTYIQSVDAPELHAML
ncbi:hypothetical protein PHMEG_00019275 [Phytophthora megakarya]|uniref:Integrase catalytic domain-containing protein n=1 Tax=Phytophthora megakarya TaxID=4795 RepID=A0A225VRY2_9STRA|nr:hypothetical protein PHMEG_00019275 [Phytophthora megakarya]